VALKRILPPLCGRREVVDMFLSEARIAMRIDHSKIVRTLDAGEVDGQPYLVMELIDGVDLNAMRRASNDSLPVGFSTHVVREVCRALAYLHRLSNDKGEPLRLVHRDVTPSNVMLARDGAVKLVDFGVAKALGLERARGTRAGVIKGKIGYMAPEQISGGKYDQRADIFAAGVILYELLANRRLFKASSDYVTLELNCACRVMPPSSANPDVPPELDAIALRALARDPDHRFQRAEDMAHKLHRVLHDLGFSRETVPEIVGERIDALVELRRAHLRTPPGDPASQAPTGVRSPLACLSHAPIALTPPRVAAPASVPSLPERSMSRLPNGVGGAKAATRAASRLLMGLILGASFLPGSCDVYARPGSQSQILLAGHPPFESWRNEDGTQ
jgi:serine/threonine protein kinase